MLKYFIVAVIIVIAAVVHVSFYFLGFGTTYYNVLYWCSENCVKTGLFTLFGFLFVVYQLRNSGRQLSNQENIARGELLLKIHQAADNEKFNKLVEFLLKRRNGKDTQPLEPLELETARGFLRLFEMIMLALNGGVLGRQDVFSLLAFRFFVLFEDASIRTNYFVKQDGNTIYRFSAIVALHRRLMDYLEEVYPDDEKRGAVLVSYGLPFDYDLSGQEWYIKLYGFYKNHHKQRYLGPRDKRRQPNSLWGYIKVLTGKAVTVSEGSITYARRGHHYCIIIYEEDGFTLSVYFEFAPQSGDSALIGLREKFGHWTSHPDVAISHEQQNEIIEKITVWGRGKNLNIAVINQLDIKSYFERLRQYGYKITTNADGSFNCVPSKDGKSIVDIPGAI